MTVNTSSPPIDDFPLYRDLLRAGLNQVSASIDLEADGVRTIKDYGLLLRALQDLQGAVVDMIDYCANEVAVMMEDDTVTLTGVGSLSRRPKTSSIWAHDGARAQMFEDARRAIVARVAKDPATGEIYQPIAMAVNETFRLVEESFSIGADPKTGFRKTLNLDPSAYRLKSRTGYAVKVDPETAGGQR